jgi:hypothetical protein
LEKLTAEVDQIKFNAEIMKGNQTVHRPNLAQTMSFENGFTKKLSGQGHEETNFLRILDQLDQSNYPQEFDAEITLRKELERIR